jgi:hypothetical protein
MLYKLPCRSQRRLDAGLNLRLVVTMNVVVLGACDDEEALYTPQAMSVADIAVILDRYRPNNNEDLPIDHASTPCGLHSPGERAD